MSYRIQAKGTLDFPDVDPKDSQALGGYFQKGEEQFRSLYESLNGRPNSKFFAARMTLLNKLSDHKSGPRMILNTAGANLHSLIGKPVHFTEDFEDHWHSKADADDDRDIKAFGVTLGGRLGKTQKDGSVPLDVFGLLWDDDHEKAVKAVAAARSEMGMSWEISAPFSSMRQIKHPSISQPILFINEYEFTGTAILKRGSAAFPESHLLVAGATGNDIDLDFESIPVLEDTELKAGTFTTESSASPSDTGQDGPQLSIIVRTPMDTLKEKPMGDFCASCKPEFEGRLSRGDIISKDDLENQKVVADLKASADSATKKEEVALEAQKKAEEEVTKLQAEKVHLEKVAEVETKAIAEWEAVKADFGDNSEIRKAYLQAQEKILLGESIESVSEGFKELLELDKKKPEKKAASSGKRFTAFDAHESGYEPDEEAKAGSSKIMKEKFGEESLKSFFRGEGFNPHQALADGEGK